VLAPASAPRRRLSNRTIKIVVPLARARGGCGRLRLQRTAACRVSDLADHGGDLPGFVATSWFALLPAEDAGAIVDKLWQAVAEALRMPDVEAACAASCCAWWIDTAATAAFLRQETERWSKVSRRPHQAG